MLLAARSNPFHMFFHILLVSYIVIIIYIFFEAPLLYFIGLMSQPENNYSYLLLLIGFVVTWQRTPLLWQHQNGPSWLGTAIIAAAMTLMLVGELGFMVRLSYAAFFLTVAGFVVAWLGRRSILLLLAPLAAFTLAVPVPGHVAVQLSTSLQQVSSILGTEILRLLGIAVFRDGNIIDLGIYQLQVAEACSGLRYLLPLMITAIFVVWLARAPLWGRLATLAAVLPLTILLNSVRIALAGALVQYSNIKTADSFIHFFEGWIIFIVGLSILIGIIWMSSWLAHGTTHPVDALDFDRIEGRALAQRLPPPAGHLPSPFALPVLVGLALMTATALYAPVMAERSEFAPERPSLSTFPLVFDVYRGTPQPLDDRIRRELRANDELLVDFTTSGEPSSINLWVVSYATQTQGAAIHSPRECLPGAGWEYEKLERKRIEVVGAADGHPFRVNETIAVKGAERIVMVYWIEGRGRRLANEFMNKIYNLYDTIVHGRSDAALVRVISRVAGTETDAAALGRIYRFIDRAYPELEPYVGDA